MNLNLLEALDQLESEKGVQKEEVLEILEKALQSAYKKNFVTDSNVEVTIDRLTGDILVHEIYEVVEEVENPSLQITVEDAKKISSKVQIGELIKKKLNVKKFKRIAAQTARQVLVQKIRELEKENLFSIYSEMKGTVTTAEVLRIGEELIDIRIGKLDTKIPIRDFQHSELPSPNSLIKVYVIDVIQTPRGPKMLVTRRSKEFIEELLKLQIPEISNGEVTVRAIAREEGIRTKIALSSDNYKVDPVGSCIGEGGTRIMEILREIKPEKIDLLKWSDSPIEMIKNSLAPADVVEVRVKDENEKEALIIVAPSQLSLAIGKGGQNARLAAKLTGWKIDIKPIM